MGILFPIAPLHGAQYTPPGIPVTWQYDSGRQAWRVVRGGTAWNEITGKPATFPPSVHTHPVTDVNGLQDILNVKQDITARGEPSGYAALDTTGKVPASQLPDGLGVSWEFIDDKPSEFPPTQHSHPVVEISDSSSVGQQLVRAPSPQAAREAIGAIGASDNARVSVKKDGVVIGVRRGVNFVTGANTTLEITDDVANEEVDVKINGAAGGGGGSASIIVSEIKPAAPFPDTLWLDVATGLMFTYYNDGTTSQWIESIPYLATMPASFTKFIFPVAPVDGATYNPIPGALWKWSSTRGVWFAVTAASASYTKAEADAKFVDIVGDTMTGALTLSADPTAPLQAATKGYVDKKVVVAPDPPPTPLSDSLWWDADGGSLYVRYNDGSTTQWVAVVGSGPAGPTGPQGVIGPAGPTGAAGPAGATAPANAYSSMTINGSFLISQELGVAGNAVGPTVVYSCDGWATHKSGSMVVNAGVVDNSPTLFPGFANYLHLIVATGQPSLGAGDFTYIVQYIEGTRIGRLSWGTAGAQPITIGFWSAHSRAGVYSIAIRNAVNAGTPNRSYAATYTHNTPSVAQYNTITIPGDTAGTWLRNNSPGMSIIFQMGSGSTYLTAPNVWTAGNFMGATGQVNGVAANTDVFRITGVVILPGTQTLTPALSSQIMPPYDVELLACQRYYEWVPFSLWFYGHAVGEPCSAQVRFAVDKRTTPTLGAVIPDNSQASANIGAYEVARAAFFGCATYISNAAVGHTYLVGHRFCADARMS